MNDGKMTVEVEPSNGRTPRRVIHLMMGDKRHVDTCDLLSGFERTKLLDRAAVALGIERHRLQDVEKAIVEKAQAADTGPRIEFPTWTLAELMAADFPITYHVENVLVAGQPAVLAGAKKVLKTSLLIDLGLSLATGGHFLGYFAVNRPARFGLMTGESGMAVVKETVERIARVAGIDPWGESRFVVTDRVPLLPSLDHLDALGAWIDHHNLEVLGIDPLYMALGDTDAASIFQVGKVLQAVNRVCQDRRVTLAICHHTRMHPTDPYAPGELSDISWAGTQEWCRQWLLLSRREKYEPGTGEHRLWLSTGGSAGHGGCWGVDISEGTRATPGGRFWEVTVTPASEVRQHAKADQATRRETARAEKAQARLESDRKAIVGAMVRLKRSESQRGIREVAGLGHGDPFHRAWASLLADSSIREAGTVRKGKTTATVYEVVTHGV